MGSISNTPPVVGNSSVIMAGSGFNAASTTVTIRKNFGSGTLAPGSDVITITVGGAALAVGKGGDLDQLRQRQL
ncbi:MAG: hypothetical protein BWY63_02209 [Chloroflexi bacterium ADurb.Bin360]|nr:MAG: hypothetical protein BWY63_02209 [Chloroflexi bacterium ADurb.Bin360]